MIKRSLFLIFLLATTVDAADWSKKRPRAVPAKEAQSSSQDTSQSPPQGSYTIPSIGIYPVELPDGRIQIASMTSGGPADKAGLRVGDILTSYDEKALASRLDLILVYKKQAGDSVRVKIVRNEVALVFDVPVIWDYIMQDIYFLVNILWSKQPVNLAIIVGEVHNNALTDATMLEQWIKGTKSQLLSGWENYYLTTFTLEPKFSVVDRSRIEQILTEQSFSQSSAVSDQVRTQLGQLLGITHIIFIEYSRFNNEWGGIADLTNIRLIDVQTGKILASYVIRQG